MGLFANLGKRHRPDWCKVCKHETEKVSRLLFAVPCMSVGHYVEHTDPEFYQKNLCLVEGKADIPAGMYACAATQYRCQSCGRRVTVLDPFLPVRDQEKHEGNIVFWNGELDDVVY